MGNTTEKDQRCACVFIYSGTRSPNPSNKPIESRCILEETVTITYSYWDGSGHRKQVDAKKGDTIAHFLEKCRQQWPELRGVAVDNLIYVKEDLIIPHVSVCCRRL